MLHTLLYFLALLSLSTSSIWAKLNQMPSSVLGFWRLSLAAVLVCIWVFAVKKMKWPRFEKKLLWVVASGLFFFGHLWTYKYAAKHTLIANMMILFSTNPIWTTLGSVLFYKEKLTCRLVLAYFFAAFAVYTLVHQQFEFNQIRLYGDLSALLSAAFFSAFMLTGKKARRSYPNSIFATIQYLLCAFLFLAAALFNHEKFTGFNEISWWSILGLVLFPTFLGHFISTYLTEHLDLSFMACGKLIEPVVAAGLAFLIFNEKVTPNSVTAFILTLISFLILFIPSLSKSWTSSKR